MPTSSLHSLTKSFPSPRPQAFVIGGGVAGLSAAFYLAERGFSVEVYEKTSAAGGNLGASASAAPGDKDKPEGTVEVYPHLFGDWYINFWQLMNKIDRGKDKSRLWRKMEEFKSLLLPTDSATLHKPKYKTLRSNGTFANIIHNVFFGQLPIPDMFLAGFSSLGILTEKFQLEDPLSTISLGDYLNTRFYRSKHVSRFYQETILNIWSIKPDITSAYAYQRFFQFQAKDPEPPAWVLNSGNAFDDLIKPLVHYMETRLGVVFHYNSTVVAASLNPNRTLLDRIMISDNNTNESTHKTISLRQSNGSPCPLIFAVPPETLAALVRTPCPSQDLDKSSAASLPHVSISQNRHGIITDLRITGKASADPLSLDACAIWHAIPELATLKVFSGEPIPVLYVVFNRNAHVNSVIPKGCYIGLSNSKYSLTLVELTNEFQAKNSHLFSDDSPAGLVIALAASDFSSLPIALVLPTEKTGDLIVTNYDNSADVLPEIISKHLMLNEAMRYLPFNVQDIRYSFFRSNTNHRLFLNDVQSADNRVQAMYRESLRSLPRVKNLAFAGDFCSENVVMATVEAAVESGFNAGQQLVEAMSFVQSDTELNHHSKPITLRSSDKYSEVLLSTIKLMLTPAAVAAKSWSDFNEVIEESFNKSNLSSSKPASAVSTLLSFYPKQASMVIGAYKDSFDTMSSIAVSTVLGTTNFISTILSRH